MSGAPTGRPSSGRVAAELPTLDAYALLDALPLAEVLEIAALVEAARRPS